MSSRGRPATGQIRPHTRRDGLTTYSLRLRVDGTRYTIRLGTEAEGWSRVRAELELENVQARDPRRHLDAASARRHGRGSDAARVRLAVAQAQDRGRNRREDPQGSRLAARGRTSCRSSAPIACASSTPSAIEAFKEHKLDERARILAAREAGEPIRDVRGRPRRTLSNGSINKLLILLGAILKNASRRGLIETNPAADIDRLPTRRREGGILEADELESLIEGAGDLTGRAGSTDVDERFRAVRELRDEQRLTWKAIAEALEIAESTAIYRYQRAGRPPRIGVADPGRRALIATLGCGGLRVSEARRTRPRRHRPRPPQDPRQGRQDRSRRPQASTSPTASPPSCATTSPPAPATRRTAPAFPTRTGGRRDKDNIRNRVLAPALRRANELRERRASRRSTCTSRPTPSGAPTSASCSPPAPTCRTCRHRSGTRIPKLTLRIYALVLKRRDRRQFGDAFDRLMRDAIPSMQHANMPAYAAASEGRVTPQIAADTIQFGPDIGPEVRSADPMRQPHPSPQRKNPRGAGSVRWS